MDFYAQNSQQLASIFKGISHGFGRKWVARFALKLAVISAKVLANDTIDPRDGLQQLLIQKMWPRGYKTDWCLLNNKCDNSYRQYRVRVKLMESLGPRMLTNSSQIRGCAVSLNIPGYYNPTPTLSGP